MSLPLWRRRDFALLWAGQTVSEVGSSVTMLALPTLAILGLGASPAAVGLLIAAQRIPFPLLSLFAGTVIDRIHKRPLMIVCNLARLGILCAIPLLATVGSLQLWHLFVAATAMGVFTVFFDIAYLAYIPSLVESHELLEANSRLEVTMSAAQLAGPGLGGLLVQAFTAPRAVLVDAFSFLLSAITLFSIRHPENRPSHERREPFLRELREGLGHVFGNPILRSQILCMGAAGIFAHAYEAPLYIFAYGPLGLSPALLGAMLASQGAGAVLGAVYASRVTRRLGVGPTITFLDGAAIGLASLIVLGTVVPKVLLFPVFILIGLTGSIGNIAQVTLRQSLSPPHLQGRMTAVFRTVFWGGWPLGNLLGGLAAGSMGAGPTLLLSALIGVCVNFSIFFTPLWKVRDFTSLDPAVLGLAGSASAAPLPSIGDP